MRVELDVHRPLLLAPGEGETVTDRPERTLRILADREELTLTWFRYVPGEKGPDPHIHRQHTDAFYVLEGELGTGAFALVPPHLPHTFFNPEDTEARCLTIASPGGVEEFIRAAALAEPADLPALGARHDTFLAGV